MGKRELIINFRRELMQAEHVLNTKYSFDLAEPYYRKCLSFVADSPEYQNDFENELLNLYLGGLVSDEPVAYLMHILRRKNVKLAIEGIMFGDSSAIASGQFHQNILSAYDDEWEHKIFYKFRD